MCRVRVCGGGRWGGCQAMLFLFAFTGAFGGYTSGRLFRMFRGTRWKANGAIPFPYIQQYARAGRPRATDRTLKPWFSCAWVLRAESDPVLSVWA